MFIRQNRSWGEDIQVGSSPRGRKELIQAMKERHEVVQLTETNDVG